MVPGCVCFSSHGSQAPVRCLWGLGLVALQPVGFSQTRDLTCIPCTDWWILNHWTTREFFLFLFLCMERGRSLVLLKSSMWRSWCHLRTLTSSPPWTALRAHCLGAAVDDGLWAAITFVYWHASEIIVSKGKCRSRWQVELRENVYRVPARCTCSLGYTSEAGKALFHQNLFRLVILLLELSDGFLVKSSLNNYSKSVQQKNPLLISV